MDVLHRIRRLRRKIPILRDEMQRAYEAATKTTGTMNDMPRASGVQSKVENGVLAYEAANQEYLNAKKQLSMLKRFLNKETLLPILNTDMQFRIIRMRYHQNMRVKTIAKECSITERHAYRILGMAEKLIDNAEDTEEYAELIGKPKKGKGDTDARDKT